jgi:hypothetical protein
LRAMLTPQLPDLGGRGSSSSVSPRHANGQAGPTGRAGAKASGARRG